MSPVLGEEFPVLGNKFPALGNKFPVLGEEFPVLGDEFPVLGKPKSEVHLHRRGSERIELEPAGNWDKSHKAKK